MKITGLFLMILGFGVSLHSQDQIQPYLGFSVSLAGTSDIRQNPDFVGGPSFDKEGYFAINLHYLQPLNSWLNLESGLSYSQSKILISGGPSFAPTLTLAPYQTKIELTSITGAFQARFLQYFYLQAGGLLELDMSSDSEIKDQSGLGGLLGLGVQYDFRNGLAVFLNPQWRYHSIISFKEGDTPHHLLNFGLHMGLLYKMGHKRSQ